MDALEVLVHDRISTLQADARRTSAARSSHRRRLALLLHRVADVLERPVGTVDPGLARCEPTAGAR